MAAQLLEPFDWSAGRAGLFCDFDGTLSEIADEPHGARPLDTVPDLLQRLAPRLGRVAIVSGRPVAYLAELLPAEVDLVGLYGLEWRADSVHHALPEAEVWRASIRQIVDEATSIFGSAAVEPKGLSLTLHYRSSGAEAQEIEAFVKERSVETGLDWRPARKSFELHPPICRDKGTALMELADGLDPVVYMGDDLGDLPAFDGLDELDRQGVGTLRVAVRSDESPPILLQRCDLVVEGPHGAAELLADILERT